MPGRPTNLDYSKATAYCACSRCGLGLFGHFFSRLSLLFSFFPLWETTEILSQRAVKPQTTNQHPPYPYTLTNHNDNKIITISSASGRFDLIK